MINISSIRARQIFDSRGNPTVECDVLLSDGAMGRAAVPSGASTGSREAIELRDGGAAYGGKGVSRAISIIHQQITPVLKGVDPFDQRAVDRLMCEADGTDNKSNFGANSILAVSLATAKASAISSGLQLHDYIATMVGSTNEQSLPMPMVNVVNGGSHAGFATDIQEYMVVPIGARDIESALEMSANIFHALGKVLKADNLPTTVGDEGGYAIKLNGCGNETPFEYIEQAVRLAGYNFGDEIVLAIDVAASEFYKGGQYVLCGEDRSITSSAMVDYLSEIADRYPIVSIEDGLDENDWSSWIEMTSRLGGDIQLVGDDLLVTNTDLLKQAIERQAANAILIKPNQIGTLSETIDAVTLARSNGWRTIMSHRSGETEDTAISHLAVGLGVGQIKTGSMSRGERTAKYNELLRIAERAPNLKLAQPLGGAIA